MFKNKKKLRRKVKNKEPKTKIRNLLIINVTIAAARAKVTAT
jgi:hypothetical protein